MSCGIKDASPSQEIIVATNKEETNRILWSTGTLRAKEVVASDFEKSQRAESAPDEANAARSNLIGIWKSGCLAIPNGLYAVNTFYINSQTISRRIILSKSSNCDDIFSEQVWEATWRAQKVGSVRNPTAITAIAFEDKLRFAETDFANNHGHCGFANWKQGEFKSILNVSSSPLCRSPIENDMEFAVTGDFMRMLPSKRLAESMGITIRNAPIFQRQ